MAVLTQIGIPYENRYNSANTYPNFEKNFLKNRRDSALYLLCKFISQYAMGREKNAEGKPLSGKRPVSVLKPKFDDFSWALEEELSSNFLGHNVTRVRLLKEKKSRNFHFLPFFLPPFKRWILEKQKFQL